ncbi:MAG TPA: M56 family metallopeptidase, partial [Pyrinomonadaceae bacterium]|nr:M56 family metallopeptidase [Pyrinomonadaceae bacterium]
MRLAVQILLTFVLNAVWQVAAIAGFAVVCDWLLRGLAARYRHYLWVITLIACVLVPILSCFSFQRSLTPNQPAAKRIEGTPIVRTRILTPGVEGLENPALTESQPVLEKQIGTPVSSRFSFHVHPVVAFVLTGLYVLLLLWRAISLGRAWRRTQNIVAGAFECAFNDSIQELIQKCRVELGAKTCRILCSAEVAVPITIGVFDRLIILPQRFAREVDFDVLTAAIGHEFQHVARHDYLMNLVYEFIYLPLSFHPAAALARRRIRHTRELCCDAAVTTKLIKPEIYARSLVTLIGSAPLHPLAPDTTIGLNESDILEVRIMSLLKTSQLSSPRRKLLLIAASLLLVTPCVAVARFPLSFNTNNQEPLASAELQQKKVAEERQNQERVTVELERQATELREQIKRAPQAQRADAEARLREVERNLELHRVELERFGQTKEQIAKSTDSAVDEAVKR